MSLASGPEHVAAYLFGVAFVVALIVIAIVFPKPSAFQFFVFRVVLALAAAGVAAMIPGFLSVQLGAVVRAGGAIAVFVIVYFLNPARLLTDSDPGSLPAGDPRATAEAYLDVADTLDFDRTWALFSATAKQIYKESDVSEAYRNVRTPLGRVSRRQLQGVQSASSWPGWPPGHYRTFGFLTVFGDGKPHGEHVTVMSEDKAWRVASHIIHPVL
jgi:hypothetical protein